MNRDELLTKLAMELGEWPKLVEDCPKAYGRWAPLFDDEHDECPVLFPIGGLYIQEHHWQARRAELVNKPSWDSAPEWAEWLAQDSDGHWEWHEDEPVAGRKRWYSDGEEFRQKTGKLIAGHDWRQTLGRRPAPEEKHDCHRCGGSYWSPYHEECPCKSGSVSDDKQSSPTTAADILRAGLGHMEDRAATYDKAEGERSMLATVRAFAFTTGIDLTEEQGWHFMALLKLVRSQQGGLRMDSYEDGAAYFGLAGEAAAKDR